MDKRLEERLDEHKAILVNMAESISDLTDLVIRMAEDMISSGKSLDGDSIEEWKQRCRARAAARRKRRGR